MHAGVIHNLYKSLSHTPLSLSGAVFTIEFIVVIADVGLHGQFGNELACTISTTKVSVLKVLAPVQNITLVTMDQSPSS